MSWVPAAISAGGAILGGLLASRGGGGQNQATSVDPYAPTIPYLNEIMKQYQGYTNSPLPYGSPDQMVAGLTPEQQAAAGTINQGVVGGQALNQQAQAGITPFLSGQMMNVENNPYLQAAIRSAVRPVTQNFQENVRPSIQSQFSVGTDAYDQSREGIARGIASRSYLDTVGDISSQMANQGYNTGMNATISSFNQVPQLTTAATAPGQAQWNIGALLQGQNQNQINAAGMFDALQQDRLQKAGNFYTQIGQIGRQGTAVTSGAQGNPYLGAVGGAVLANQAYRLWPTSQTPTPTPPPNSQGMDNWLA